MIRQHSNLVGQQFGSYRLLHLLGTGGFAEVYLGEHTHLGTQAAVKVLHTQLPYAAIDTFRAEARTIARLLHPHVIRVLDFNVEGSTPFLVMDYAIGGTMRERCPRGATVPLPTVVSYIQQITDALQYAHDQKLIHRDVKPENILLDQHHNVLLSDFGIALVAQSSCYQSSQNVTGTATYISPEQIQGKPRPTSDQYALGIVVYEWLSGAVPFEGSFPELCAQHMFAPPPPLREKIPTISPDVEQVVMTALAKDPNQRFDSVRAFAIALQQASQARQAQTTTPLRLQAGYTGSLRRIVVPSQSHKNNLIPAIPSQSYKNSLIPAVPSQPYKNNLIPARPSSSNSKPQGSMRWLFRTGGPIFSSPAVVNDIVYFGSGQGRFYALHVALELQKWSFRTSGAVYSSPTVVNDIVYFGSDDHHLYAIDAAFGRKLWSFSTGGLVYSSPTVVNNIVYFGSEDRNLYAIDATSGMQKWSFRTGRAISSSPTVVNGIVYFGSNDRHLYAIDATSGQKKWSFRTGGLVYSSPTVINGIVYFSSDDCHLYALHAFSGQKRWSFPTGDKITSSPAVVNGVVYCGSNDRYLYALDAFSGQKKWSFLTGDKITSSPAVANGVVYFGSNDHRLYALDTTSGQKKWSFRTGGKVTSSPAVANGVVYVGSDDGKLYAIFV